MSLTQQEIARANDEEERQRREFLDEDYRQEQRKFEVAKAKVRAKYQHDREEERRAIAKARREENEAAIRKHQERLGGLKGKLAGKLTTINALRRTARRNKRKKATKVRKEGNRKTSRSHKISEADLRSLSKADRARLRKFLR